MLSCEHCQQEHDESHAVCPVTGKLFRPERMFPLGMVLEGKYRLEEVLGAGGMGVVFRARHTLLDKVVAVKLTLPQLACDEQVMARMVREARAASGTGHRNIATVTDMGWTHGGGLFLVMEYLEGVTLHAMVAEDGPLEVARAAGLTAQILSGLAAVHTKGVVHRDLKPENVMVVYDDEGCEQVKVLDFGISKILGDDQSLELTQTGTVMGSPRYMSPEQARGIKDLDHRVDLYAAGGILYTLMVGSPPLWADNYHAMLAAILAGRIPRPSEQLPTIPRALDAVVLRAMALEPQNRYADAVTFRKALMPFLEATDGATVPELAKRGVGGAAAVAQQGGGGLDLSALSADSLVALDEVDDDRRRPVAAAAQPVASAPPPGGTGQPASSAVSSAPEAGPSVGGDAFAPPVEASSVGFGPDAALSASLEVDRDYKWHGGAAARPRQEPPSQSQVNGKTLYSGAKRSLSAWLTRAVSLAVLLLLGAGAWWFYDHYLEDPPGDSAVGESVMVLVETEPRDADVYVDGVLQVTAPIQLPRSDGLFSVRISARGYRSKTLQIRADRTHTVRVKLERQGR